MAAYTHAQTCQGVCSVRTLETATSALGLSALSRSRDSALPLPSPRAA